MRNIIKRIIAVFLVIIANISLVACDVNILDTSVFGEEGTHRENKTEDESENENGSEVVLSVNATEQSSDTWKMTYKGCEVSKEIDSFTTAENGKEFVFVFFEIENISDELQVFDLFSADFYVDGFKISQTLYGGSVNDSFQLVGMEIQSERKVNGYFLFQTSSDWSELEIIYNDSSYDEDDENVIRFILNRNGE